MQQVLGSVDGLQATSKGMAKGCGRCHEGYNSSYTMNCSKTEHGALLTFTHGLQTYVQPDEPELCPWV